MLVPIGKHQGAEIRTLSANYVLWALSQQWLCAKFPAFALSLLEELTRRMADPGAFCKSIGLVNSEDESP